MAKKERYPAFLNDVEVDSGDIEECTGILSNWLKTHAYVSKLKADERSLGILRRLMLVEYLRKPGPRMDIVVRLHGRFDRLRYEVERVQLAA